MEVCPAVQVPPRHTTPTLPCWSGSQRHTFTTHPTDRRPPPINTAHSFATAVPGLSATPPRPHLLGQHQLDLLPDAGRVADRRPLLVPLFDRHTPHFDRRRATFDPVRGYFDQPGGGGAHLVTVVGLHELDAW